MTQQELSTLIQSSVAYAASNLHLDMSGYRIIVNDWTSRGINHCGINAETKIIACNIIWINECLAQGDNYDIPYLIMHEVRHHYQHQQIENNKNGKPISESRELVEKWEWESKKENYIWNDGTTEKESLNQQQSVEVDANAFAALMMMKKTKVFQTRFHTDADDVTTERLTELIPIYAPELIPLMSKE